MDFSRILIPKPHLPRNSATVSYHATHRRKPRPPPSRPSLVLFEEVGAVHPKRSCWNPRHPRTTPAPRSQSFGIPRLQRASRVPRLSGPASKSPTLPTRFGASARSSNRSLPMAEVRTTGQGRSSKRSAGPSMHSARPKRPCNTSERDTNVSRRCWSGPSGWSATWRCE